MALIINEFCFLSFKKTCSFLPFFMSYFLSTEVTLKHEKYFTVFQHVSQNKEEKNPFYFKL